MNTNAEPIVVEATYKVPPEVVWKAITDKDQMCEWFFKSMTEFNPEVGFETQFSVRCEDQDYLHIWRVTNVVPQQSISYQWQYGGCTGDSAVTWKLSENRGGTKLKLTHAGSESFPQDNPNFRRENCEAGWEYFLQDSLRAFLESRDS